MAKSLIMRLKKDKAPLLVFLSKTRHITDNDVAIHAAWQLLKEGYQDIKNDPNSEWVDMAMHSLLNSIVYQQRIFFCFHRDRTRELLKEDTNWGENGIGFDNNDYKFLREQMMERGIIEKYDNSNPRKPIYRVIHPEILEMIRVDSPDEQLSQVTDYINKKASDANSDANSDAEQKNNRKIEQQTKTETTTVSENVVNLSSAKDNNSSANSTVNKITFKQLLFRQHPDDLPRFQDLSYLAELAVQNCEDFEVDNFTIKTFKKHLEGICGKPTPKQKKLIDKLVGTFEREAEKIVSLRAVDGIELEQPTELKAKALLREVESEDVIQSNTLNILKATFGKEKIDILKLKLEEAEDPELKMELEAELQHWERTLGLTGE